MVGYVAILDVIPLSPQASSIAYLCQDAQYSVIRHKIDRMNVTYVTKT